MKRKSLTCDYRSGGLHIIWLQVEICNKRLSIKVQIIGCQSLQCTSHRHFTYQQNYLQRNYQSSKPIQTKRANEEWKSAERRRKAAAATWNRYYRFEWNECVCRKSMGLDTPNPPIYSNNPNSVPKSASHPLKSSCNQWNRYLKDPEWPWRKPIALNPAKTAKLCCNK